MGRVRVAAVVPGPPDAVMALWRDTRRWPSFVDGFRTVTRVEGDLVVWDSTPAGGGRTYERRTSDAVTDVETEQYRGKRTVTAEPGDGDDVLFSVELRYELKERTLVTPLVDRFFVRRALADSLSRTVRRFAVERRADAGGL